MSKVKVVVLVSGGGTNLQALIDAQDSGIIKSAEIVKVVSNKEGAYALERASKAGIPSVVITKKNKTQDEFESSIIEEINISGGEIIVLAGFMAILSEKFTSTFPNRIINVHPSLIPSFCGKGFYGLHVHEAALEYGVKVSGATVHFVNEIPDGGKIIMQKAVEIRDDDTPQTLQKRIMEEAEWKILPAAVEKVAKEIVF